MRSVKGVIATRVGYTGGTKKKGVHYRSLGDHTEACQVDFDPRIISYRDMLALFWKMHDPFKLKMSTQYRNCLWFHSEAQKKAAEESIADLNTISGRHVLTPLEPIGPFWRAEEYHQQYLAKRRRR